MSSGLILAVFTVFFLLEFIFEFLLTILNIKCVKSNRGKLPELYKGDFDEEIYGRSSRYTLTKSRFSLVSSLFSAAFLLTVVLSGSFGKASLLIDGYIDPGIFNGIIYIFTVAAVFRVISLPFTIYSQFGIENKFGFNNMTPGLFISDLLKSSLFSILLMFPVLGGIFILMENTGAFWWIYGFLFFMLVQVIILFLYPVLIAPFFNKFSPLEEGELKDKLLKLAERMDFHTNGIFVMDGSRRSSHSNAYFTGLGKLKRIVLYDTLVKSLSADQLSAVLAHEIGHEKKHHIIKRIVVSVVFTFAAFLLISLLAGYLPLFEAFGFSRLSPSGILVIIAFCSGPFTAIFTPFLNAWSRKNEYEADAFAFEAVNGSNPLIEGLIILHKENLSNLTPHPLYSFYHYSHPVLTERINALRALP